MHPPVRKPIGPLDQRQCFGSLACANHGTAVCTPMLCILLLNVTWNQPCCCCLEIFYQDDDTLTLLWNDRDFAIPHFHHLSCAHTSHTDTSMPVTCVLIRIKVDINLSWLDENPHKLNDHIPWQSIWLDLKNKHKLKVWSYHFNYYGSQNQAADIQFSKQPKSWQLQWSCGMHAAQKPLKGALGQLTSKSFAKTCMSW